MAAPHGKLTLALVLGVLLCGCRGLLDANDFGVGEPSGPTVGEAFFNEACLECTAVQCADEHVTCDADPGCTDSLECSKNCGTPDCFVECWLPYKRHPTPVHTVEECALRACPDVCLSGANYGCLGQYGWPRLYPGGQHPEDATETFNVGFFPNFSDHTFDGLRVQAGGVEAQTDEDGRAWLTVPIGLTGYTDGLFVDDPTGAERAMPTYVRRGTQPLRDNFEYPAWPLFDRETLDLGLTLVEPGGTYDETKAYFTVQFFDCLRQFAYGLEVTVEGGDETTLVAYAEDNIPVQAGSRSETSADGVAFVGPLPPGVVRITATEAATGRRTHTASVVVEAGRLYFLRPWPLTTDQAR